MAVIDYKFVYKDGASLGAREQSLKVADTLSELPATGNQGGDFGWATNTTRMYVWLGAWYQIALSIDVPPAFVGGVVSFPFHSVYEGVQLAGRDPNAAVWFRLLNYNDGAATMFSHNMYGFWGKDYGPWDAYMLHFDNTNGAVIYGIKGGADNTLNTLLSVNREGDTAVKRNFAAINGTLTIGGHSSLATQKNTGYIDSDTTIRARQGLYDWARTPPIGNITAFTPEIWVLGGDITGFINGGSYYTLIGNQMTIHVVWDFNFSNVQNQFYFRIPAGGYAHIWTTAIMEMNNGGAGSWLPVYCVPQASNNYVTVKRCDNGSFYAGAAKLQGQMIIQCYNVGGGI